MDLNWFHFLALVDRAIMNQDAQASLWLDIASFSACPEARSYGDSDFSLWRPSILLSTVAHQFALLQQSVSLVLPHTLTVFAVPCFPTDNHSGLVRGIFRVVLIFISPIDKD